MIKSVIFDYGGVVAGKVTDFYVIDGCGQKVQGDPSLELVARKLGLTYDQIIQKIGSEVSNVQRGEIQEKILWEKIAATYNLSLPLGHDTLWAEKYLELYPENLKVVNLINNLKDKRILVGLLSNTVPSHAAINYQAGRLEKFDFTILSCHVGLRKPEEEIYEKALLITKSYGVIPSECVYIDDVEAYLEPAKKLGMQVIYFRNGEHEFKTLKEKLSWLGLQL